MKNGLKYDQNDLLCFSGCEVASLAESYGTPLYVYSADLIQKQVLLLQKALQKRKHLICYSVKANSNLSLLHLLHKQGCGADIVSGGELYRCLKVNIPTHQIVYSGVGKSPNELKMALEADILLFSVESEAELLLLASIAKNLGRVARVSLRINPAVEADTHPYIRTGREHHKFGIPSTEIVPLYEQSRKLSSIHICALGFHIGSQIMDTEVFGSAAKILQELHDILQTKGFVLEYANVGGGLGISYQNDSPPSIKSYLESIDAVLNLKEACLILEPGRFIMGNSGILVSQVLYTKHSTTKDFYIIDAAMNDLMRPSLYQAYHEILAHCKKRKIGPPADMVGPICETSDFFAHDRQLPAFQSGDYAIVCSAGAYGFSMSSNYNSRGRAAEVLVHEGSSHLIRQRESYEDLVRLEPILRSAL